MDRGDIISFGNTVKTDAGTFKNCMKIIDSSGIEDGEAAPKFYAPGVRLLQDEYLKLTGYGYV